MITRRDAVKLAAAGFLVPTGSRIAAAQTPVASPVPSSVSTRGSWPMAGGNPARSGVMPGPIPSMDAPIIVRWRFQPAEDWLRTSEPMIADGVAYIRGEERIYAINVDSGLEYWRYELPEVSFLTISNSVVYATTYAGTVHAIAAEPGQEMWRYGGDVEAGTPVPYESDLQSPVVTDGMVVICGAGAIQVLDASTGIPAWQFATRLWSTPPIVADGMILASGEEGVIARDLSTGEERWRSTNHLGAVGVVGATVIAGGEDFLSGLDIAAGQELWRYTSQQTLETGAFADTLMLLTIFTENEYGYYEGEVQAIDVATGGLHWLYDLGEVSEPWGTEMRVVGDMAFVKLREPDNLLLALDTTTGLKEWEYRGYITDIAPVAVDNYLYFVHDNELFAIGNLLDPVLMSDVTLRAAPAESGIERGTAQAGDTIASVGARADSNGEPWVEITVGGITGWVPAAAIDPATLPPEGEIWTIYDPAWF